jgi:hypothetical protein
MVIFERGKAGIMTVFGKHSRWFFVLMTSLLLIPPLAASGAESSSKAAAYDAEKKKTAREKAFLLRAVEEQDRTLTLVMETTALLEKQADAVESLETDRRRRDLKDLLDWYYAYTGWVGGMAAESEADLAEHLSRPSAGAGWETRYEGMAKGYRRLTEDLSGKIRALEAEQSKVEARIKKLKPAVLERRILVDKEELELSKELRPTYRYNPYDSREAVYRDLTDDEVGQFQRELKMLEEYQKHYEVVTELGRYELGWLSIKAGESAVLQGVAQALVDDSPGAMRNAYREAIRTYDADVTALNRKVDVLQSKITGITRTGTLKTLDRLKDLTDYYENMKSRYERQAEWLKGQIGGFQADLVELERETSQLFQWK